MLRDRQLPTLEPKAAFSRSPPVHTADFVRPQRVVSASFSPDGTHVVTASSDKTARVWDLRGERPRFVAIEGHGDELRSASFSPDGTRVATASRDGTARVWRVYPDANELIPLIRASLSRCLSQAQRDAYGLVTEHRTEDRNFVPPPTADGRCPS